MGTKQIYLIRGNKEESYESFASRMLALGNRLLTNLQPTHVKITLTEQAPPSMAVIPFKKKKIAAISVVSREAGSIAELVREEGFYGAYVVDEAIPVGYDKNWSDGEKTPGIGLLTLFHKKKNIDYETFLDRWHNGHTPLSLRIHPLWNYNRNVVKEKLTDHEYWYDGIVEEHFRERKDLLNIFRFFGKPHKVLFRMLNVYTDTNSFLDYGKIETYLVTEYILAS